MPVSEARAIRTSAPGYRCTASPTSAVLGDIISRCARTPRGQPSSWWQADGIARKPVSWFGSVGAPWRSGQREEFWWDPMQLARHFRSLRARHNTARKPCRSHGFQRNATKLPHSKTKNERVPIGPQTSSNGITCWTRIPCSREGLDSPDPWELRRECDSTPAASTLIGQKQTKAWPDSESRAASCRAGHYISTSSSTSSQAKRWRPPIRTMELTAPTASATPGDEAGALVKDRTLPRQDWRKDGEECSVRQFRCQRRLGPWGTRHQLASVSRNSRHKNN